jgi:hypothetical protein
MLVFLDTEFTDLLNPELLSLGLVTLDGREHYAELNLTSDVGQARVKASSDFVRYGGISDMWRLVPGATGSEWEMERGTGECSNLLVTSSKVGFSKSDQETLRQMIEKRLP